MVKSWPRWAKISLGIFLVMVVVSVMMLSNKESGATIVKTAKVENQGIEQSVISSGRLESTEKQEFFTPVDSTLMELSVKVGDKVEQGQVLGRLDTNELGRQYQQSVARLAGLEANLARAQSLDDELVLKQTEASYNKAKNGLERIDFLYKEGAVTVEQLESVQVEYARAEVDYQQALIKSRQGSANKEVASLQAQVDLGLQEVAQAKERLDLATFITQNSGVVLFIGAEKGNRVMEGSRLMVVGSDSKLEVTAFVNEIDAGNLKLDQAVKITCAALPGVENKGKVTRVSAAAISQQSSQGDIVNVPVTIQLDGDTSGLKPGYTVNLTIITLEKREMLAIPFESIVEKQGRKLVYLVENGVAKERQVQTEKGNELYDKVISGLSSGEIIVLNPPNSIKDGQKVLTGDKK